MLSSTVLLAIAIQRFHFTCFQIMYKIRKFCMKFAQLLLRKIFISVANRCHILRIKCTKFNFGWGSAPDPTGGAYSAPPDLLAGFKGPTSKGGEGVGNCEWEWAEEKGTPRVGSHPMSEILKNTLIAELIWLAGAATQAFSPGGKRRRAAVARLSWRVWLITHQPTDGRRSQHYPGPTFPTQTTQLLTLWKHEYIKSRQLHGLLWWLIFSLRATTFTYWHWHYNASMVFC